MQTPPLLTDRPALDRNRLRALRAPAFFLQDAALDELKERLTEVNRTFTSPAVVTPFRDLWQSGLPEAKIVADTEVLDLADQSHDLLVHAMALHWANDPVGQLIQCRRALKSDGLFIALLFGGLTLFELRSCLAVAESQTTSGLSPRVLPMGEIRDLGGLLQRAGFALPVADSLTTTVIYRDIYHLMADLRGMGENNALAQRLRRPTRRTVFASAARHYQQTFATANGRIPATFEMICLTGWAPADSQQKPLRPGSASHRLADQLETDETPLT